jgi:hypothetical protein
MTHPALIRTPLDVKSELAFLSTREETLKLAIPHDFGFDMHWLRDTGLGILAGDVGLRLNACMPASVDYELAGFFRRVVSLDERRRLRLRIFHHPGEGPRFASRLSVRVRGPSAHTGGIDELAAAILGIHEQQSPRDPAGLGAGRSLPLVLESGLLNLAGFLDLDKWVRSRLEDLFGPIRSEADLAALAQRLPIVLKLRDSIYHKAASALERMLAVDACSLYHSADAQTPLLDSSFDFSEEGLDCYRQALSGDYRGLSSWCGERLAVLDRLLGRCPRIELHLPLMGRQEWSSRLQSLCEMEVECDEGGRLFALRKGVSNRLAGRNEYLCILGLAGPLAVGRVHSTERFSVSFSDKRTLRPAQVRATLAPAIRGYGFDNTVEQWLEGIPLDGEDIEVSLDFSIPGALMKEWWEAPTDNAPDYYHVYPRVSFALQQTLRRWLPYFFFDHMPRYSRLGPALSLIVYQLSRALLARSHGDLTYDVWSEASVQKLIRSASARLGRTLPRIGRLLAASNVGKGTLYYAAKQTRRALSWVRRSRRYLQGLLAAESIFVNALVKLGCSMDGVRRELDRDRKKAERMLTGLACELAKTFQARLRLLYASGDFQSLGPLLLLETTNALHVAQGGEPSVRAVLRLRRGKPGEEGSFDVTVVNGRAFSPGPHQDAMPARTSRMKSAA